MSNDTPRTDMESIHVDPVLPIEVVKADHARTLERENAALRQRLAELEKDKAIPFNEDIQTILGRVNFMSRDIARRLEELGLYPVMHKSEVEQAIVAHWSLNLYLKHGAAWREEGWKILSPEPDSAMQHGASTKSP